MDNRGQVQMPVFRMPKHGFLPQNSSAAFTHPGREESPPLIPRSPLDFAIASLEAAWSSRLCSLPPQKPRILRLGVFCNLCLPGVSQPLLQSKPRHASERRLCPPRAGPRPRWPPCPRLPIGRRPPPTRSPKHPWGHWIASLRSDFSGAP